MAGRSLIYLFAAYLFICGALSSLISSTRFFAVLPSYLFKREKFKAAPSAEGEAC